MRVEAFVICHRLERLVDRAVASIVTQSRLPDRIVLVGTDARAETRQKLEAWRTLCPSVVTAYSPVPLSVSQSKNLAATLCPDGEDQAFFTLDADDWIYPEFVRLLAGHMESNGAAVVGCDYHNVMEDGRIVMSPKNGMPIDRIAEEDPLPSCSIIRRSAFTQVGGYDEDLGYEDWGLWLKMYRRGYFLYRWPQVQFAHVRHGENVSLSLDAAECRAQILRLDERLRGGRRA